MLPLHGVDALRSEGDPEASVTRRSQKKPEGNRRAIRRPSSTWRTRSTCRERSCRFQRNSKARKRGSTVWLGRARAAISEESTCHQTQSSSIRSDQKRSPRRAPANEREGTCRRLWEEPRRARLWEDGALGCVQMARSAVGRWRARLSEDGALGCEKMARSAVGRWRARLWEDGALGCGKRMRCKAAGLAIATFASSREHLHVAVVDLDVDGARVLQHAALDEHLLLQPALDVGLGVHALGRERRAERLHLELELRDLREAHLPSVASRCNQRQSAVISGNQWQSMAISGEQWQSAAISGAAWRSVVISGNQWQSVASSGNKWSSDSATIASSRSSETLREAHRRGGVRL